MQHTKNTFGVSELSFTRNKCVVCAVRDRINARATRLSFHSILKWSNVLVNIDTQALTSKLESGAAYQNRQSKNQTTTTTAAANTTTKMTEKLCSRTFNIYIDSCTATILIHKRMGSSRHSSNAGSYVYTHAPFQLEFEYVLHIIFIHGVSLVYYGSSFDRFIPCDFPSAAYLYRLVCVQTMRLGIGWLCRSCAVRFSMQHQPVLLFTIDSHSKCSYQSRSCIGSGSRSLSQPV